MPVSIHQHKDDEHKTISLLMEYFDWQRCECFPNVMCFPWESDLLVVSDSGYVTEVEVKHSLSDWRADLKKQKFTSGWHRQQFDRVIRRFYYAVPQHLVDQAPADLPDFAGIISVGRSCKTVREAKLRTTEKIEPGVLRRLQRSVYFRFCREYRRGVLRTLDVHELPSGYAPPDPKLKKHPKPIAGWPDGW